MVPPCWLGLHGLRVHQVLRGAGGAEAAQETRGAPEHEVHLESLRPNQRDTTVFSKILGTRT